MLTEQKRETLQEELAGLGAAMDKVLTARIPFDDAISAIEAVRDGLLERYNVDIVGNCEGCGCIILAGDEGHRTAEDVLLCKEHSPTWADVEEQYENMRPDDAFGIDPEDIVFGKEAAAAHIADGGSLDDKHVWEL